VFALYCYAKNLEFPRLCRGSVAAVAVANCYGTNKLRATHDNTRDAGEGSFTRFIQRSILPNGGSAVSQQSLDSDEDDDEDNFLGGGIWPFTVAWGWCGEWAPKARAAADTTRDATPRGDDH
jgi:hypothetical protein